MGTAIGEWFAGLPRTLRFYRKADDTVDILAVTQVDTEGAPLTPASANFGNNADAVAPTTTGNSGSDSYLYIFDGTNWDRQRALGAAGDGLGVNLASQPSSTPTSVTGALGAAATITYAAVAGQRHRLTHLSCSAGAASTLTVTDGGTTIWTGSVASGLTNVPLPPGGIQGSVNSAMVITVAGVAAQTMTANAAKLTA